LIRALSNLAELLGWLGSSRAFDTTVNIRGRLLAVAVLVKIRCHCPGIVVEPVHAHVNIIDVLHIRGGTSASNMREARGAKRSKLFEAEITLGVNTHRIVGGEDLEDELVVLNFDRLDDALTLIVHFFDRPLARQCLQVIGGSGHSPGKGREADER